MDVTLKVERSMEFPPVALESVDIPVSARPVALSTHSAGRRDKTTRAVTVKVAARIEAAPERVFAAWLDPAIAKRWLFATASQPVVFVEIDARVGGAFRFVERRRGEFAVHSGRYLEIVPGRRLVFSLVSDGRTQLAGRVSVEFAPTRNGCKIAVTHENVARDRAHDSEGRWCGMLYGLDLTLDSIRRNATKDCR